MAQKVITTVGISSLLNYMKEETRSMEEFLPNHENYRSIDHAIEKCEDCRADQYETMLTQIKEIHEIISTDWMNMTRSQASAESQSLLKIAKNKKIIDVYLLATDTVLSVLSCELLVEWLPQIREYEGQGIKMIPIFDRNSEYHVIKGLQVKDGSEFETEGFSNLLSAVQHWESVANGQPRPILNISGGYKAITPIMTILGQLYNMPVMYIYEESNDLICLDQSPLGVDWGLLARFSSALHDTANLEGGNLNSAYKAGLVKTNSSPATLTVMGKMLAGFSNDELPFEKTLNGYMIEHKLFEYYLKSPYNPYSKIEHSYKLNLENEEDMDDADLWMTTPDETSAIIGEIKPDNWNIKRYKTIIKKRIDALIEPKRKNLKEFWLILYGYTSINPVIYSMNWEEISTGIKGIRFKVKAVVIPDNEIDGKTNQFSRHIFYRSKIDSLLEIFPV